MWLRPHLQDEAFSGCRTNRTRRSKGRTVSVCTPSGKYINRKKSQFGFQPVSYWVFLCVDACPAKVCVCRWNIDGGNGGSECWFPVNNAAGGLVLVSGKAWSLAHGVSIETFQEKWVRRRGNKIQNNEKKKAVRGCEEFLYLWSSCKQKDVPCIINCCLFVVAFTWCRPPSWLRPAFKAAMSCVSTWLVYCCYSK